MSSSEDATFSAELLNERRIQIGMATGVAFNKIAAAQVQPSNQSQTSRRKLAEDCSANTVVLNLEFLTDIEAERDSFANAFYVNKVQRTVGNFTSCGTPIVRTGRSTALKSQSGIAGYILGQPFLLIVMMFFIFALFSIPQLLSAVGKHTMEEGMPFDESQIKVSPSGRMKMNKLRRATISPGYEGTPGKDKPRAKLEDLIASLKR